MRLKKLKQQSMLKNVLKSFNKNINLTTIRDAENDYPIHEIQ